MDNRFFPLVVVAIMLALGLTLSVADFQRAAKLRRPLLVALLCQTVLLPLLCLLIAEALDLQPSRWCQAPAPADFAGMPTPPAGRPATAATTGPRPD